MRSQRMQFSAAAMLCGISITFGASASVTLPQEGTWRTTLESRDLDHDGTPDAYYDRALNITWQANPNLSGSETFGVKLDYPSDIFGTMTWVQSQKWLAGMNAANHLGFNDWRLPKMSDSSAVCDDFGGGGNCGSPYFLSADSSEFAHLMFVTLGTTGLSSYTTPFVSNTGKGYGSIAPFYWMQTSYAGNTGDAWTFEFRFGGWQWHDSKTGDNNYVWAVRDGDVASVPEASAAILTGMGLMMLVLLRKRKERA